MNNLQLFILLEKERAELNRMIDEALKNGTPIAETQEILDFSAANGITCDIEMLDIKNINQAFERVQKGDVKYRFVIDMNTLKA